VNVARLLADEIGKSFFKEFWEFHLTRDSQAKENICGKIEKFCRKKVSVIL